MCGIAGFYGNFSQRHLQQMNALIAHRGPDDADTWCSGADPVGLAHRRLSIIDLSAAGRQPMWDATRKAVIVFNGEIYNYRELARDLRRDGFVLKSQSDTEVLLNLYLRDGDQFLTKLDGMFAFAIWDLKRKRMFIARDGTGVKPLYYFENRFGFAFASELKALCCLPELERTIDPIALSHYLTYLYCPAPRTPLTGVFKLEPGWAIAVENGHITNRWQHWKLPVQVVAETRSVPELEEELEALLSSAVRRQMVADVPVGAFLSGGLDSSAIVALGRKYAAGQKLDCFTIGFEDEGVGEEGFPNDLPYAQKVAQHLDVPLHVVKSGSGMARDFEKMIYHLDEPQPDPAALNVLQIARLSREMGIKVLLSGAGGDDIFGGYRRHFALSLEFLWAWQPQVARSMLQTIAVNLPRTTPLRRRLAKAFEYAGESQERRIAGYFAWLESSAVCGLFSPDVRSKIVGSDPLSPMLTALQELPANMESLNRMLYLEQRFFLPDHNLNYTDKMAMAAGIEVRVPFLDPHLMTFAANLPARYKQYDNIGKWLFKRSMEIHLPHDIIYRPKTGFGAPLRSWMQGELRDHFERALAPETISRRGIFDPKRVTEMVINDRTGRIDAAYPLFGLVCIETWCRQFLDQRPGGQL